jgi:hypothetical protein
MASSFAASMTKFASSGFKTADDECYRLRVEQCLRCGHRKSNRCSVCGCFFVLKAKLPHEDCPIGRWPV